MASQTEDEVQDQQQHEQPTTAKVASKRKPPSCVQCRWFAPANEERTHGICRRHAPLPTVASSRDEPLGTYWPFVDQHDYCGDFA